MPRLSLCWLFPLLLLPASSLLAEDGPDNQVSTPANEAPADNEPSAGTSEPQTDTTARPRVIPQTEAQRHQGVLEHLSLYQRDREVVQLLAAEDAFNGLYLPHTNSSPQGGILLLHDNGQHGHWPTVTAPLREYLPRYGWNTLAIELPQQPAGELPPRGDYHTTTEPEQQQTAQIDQGDSEQQADNRDTSADTRDDQDNPIALDSNGISLSSDPDEAQANNPAEPPLPALDSLPPVQQQNQPAEDETATDKGPDATQRYQQQMRARVNAAMAYLTSRGQLNLVIIANGNSASWAVDYLLNRQQQKQTDGELQGFALVMVDARQNRNNPLYLDDQLQQLRIPVLDVLTRQRITSTTAMERRAGAMRRKQRQQYQQLQLDTPQPDQYSQQLQRRVRGWLKSHAAGTELPASKS